MRLLDVMTEARLHSGCAVLPPTSLPRLRDDIETLPADLVTFYRSCGGATLFMGQAGEVQVLAPEDVIPANPVIAGDPWICPSIVPVACWTASPSSTASSGAGP
jgi:hypothetical protein